MAAGARLEAACEILGLTARTLERWGEQEDDGRHGPNTVPANKLTEAERRQIIAVTTSPEFRDQSPKQIVPRLADQGRYIASEATFYRTLHAANTASGGVLVPSAPTSTQSVAESRSTIAR